LASAGESSEDVIEIDRIGPADADPFPRRWPRRSQWDKRVCNQTMLYLESFPQAQFAGAAAAKWSILCRLTFRNGCSC
jgi:hypothetical protein